MAKTEHYYTQFESERFYHVYNRTIDKGKLFSNRGNYLFFLKKFDEYLSDYVETYAYCLLGNHFHWLIRVLPEQEIRSNLAKYAVLNPAKILSKNTKEKNIHEIISHQFRKFFQSYAMAYNKQHERDGTLFQTPFKRALVDNDAYFTNLIHYIHANPQRHGIIADFRDYEWSSYQRFLIEKPTKLRKEEVLKWFGNKEQYLRFHANTNNIDIPPEWNLDD